MAEKLAERNVTHTPRRVLHGNPVSPIYWETGVLPNPARSPLGTIDMAEETKDGKIRRISERDTSKTSPDFRVRLRESLAQAEYRLGQLPPRDFGVMEERAHLLETIADIRNKLNTPVIKADRPEEPKSEEQSAAPPVKERSTRGRKGILVNRWLEQLDPLRKQEPGTRVTYILQPGDNISSIRSALRLASGWLGLNPRFRAIQRTVTTPEGQKQHVLTYWIEPKVE